MTAITMMPHVKVFKSPHQELSSNTTFFTESLHTGIQWGGGYARLWKEWKRKTVLEKTPGLRFTGNI